MVALTIFLGFLLLPVLEIYVIIQVGQVIGGWQTAALLLAESLLGAWIIRREGRRAWRELNEAVNTGVMPGRELADGVLILVGGALLLTPGFVTDAIGFVFVLPFTRPLVRKAMSVYIARRVTVMQTRAGFVPPSASPPAPDDSPGSVISGEVVQDDPGDKSK